MIPVSAYTVAQYVLHLRLLGRRHLRHTQLQSRRCLYGWIIRVDRGPGTFVLTCHSVISALLRPIFSETARKKQWYFREWENECP